MGVHLTPPPLGRSRVNTHCNLLPVKAGTSYVKINYNLGTQHGFIITMGSFKKRGSASHRKFDPAVRSLVNVFKNWNFKYH